MKILGRRGLFLFCDRLFSSSAILLNRNTLILFLCYATVVKHYCTPWVSTMLKRWGLTSSGLLRSHIYHKWEIHTTASRAPQNSHYFKDPIVSSYKPYFDWHERTYNSDIIHARSPHLLYYFQVFAFYLVTCIFTYVDIIRSTPQRFVICIDACVSIVFCFWLNNLLIQCNSNETMLLSFLLFYFIATHFIGRIGSWNFPYFLVI